MALVLCKFCEAKISDKAIYCPKCGKSTIHGKINIFSAYKRIWTKAFDYKGFTGKKEYQLGIAGAFLIQLLFYFLYLVSLLIDAADGTVDFTDSFNLALFFLIALTMHGMGSMVAWIALLIRRFRDTGTKPIGVFFILIPILGIIYVGYITNKKSRRDVELTFFS